jgi:hypothetical protein
MLRKIAALSDCGSHPDSPVSVTRFPPSPLFVRHHLTDMRFLSATPNLKKFQRQSWARFILDATF